MSFRLLIGLEQRIHSSDVPASMLEMSSTQALRVEHLSHHYAETPVLFDVSLTLERGDVLALVGPSGSGKSTLLHLIGALEPPQQGKIWA